MNNTKPLDRLVRVKAEIDSFDRSGFEQWIASARGNDAEAARDLLAALVIQLRELSFPSSPISLSLAHFAADAFSAYLEGTHSTLDKAFGLAKGRGAPTTATAAHLEIARKILLMQLAGKSWNDIYDAASTQDWSVTNARELRRIYMGLKVKVMSEELSRRLEKNDDGEEGGA